MRLLISVNGRSVLDTLRKGESGAIAPIALRRGTMTTAGDLLIFRCRLVRNYFKKTPV